MLSDDAYEMAFAFREYVGSDHVGVGPDIETIITLLPEMGAQRISAALGELDQIGFIRLDRAIAVQSSHIPRELRGIVGTAVLEPLQSYMDERE